MNHRLNLQLRKDASPDALVEQLAAHAAQLHCRDPACSSVIEKRCDGSDVIKWHILHQVVEHVAELSSCEIACAVDVECLRQLSDGQLLLLDAVCETT